MRSFLKVAAMATLMLVMGSLSACNTAEGFGRDMEKAGQSIQKSV
ncbi:MAG TPA: entericidin EcnAB [Rhodospirillaceae bacterium]|nr:entericidin EcnAB [Rhodospirillaceae bacterium]